MARGLPTIYRKLTKNQRQRGVIFSSALLEYKNQPESQASLHEVKANDPKAQEKIKRLKDTSFFAATDSPYTHNLIRQ